MTMNFARRGLRLATFAPALALAVTLHAPLDAEAQSISPPIACDETTGMAGAFACESVDLLAIVPSFELSSALCELLPWQDSPFIDAQSPTPLTGSDMWGWTHKDSDGNVREFAVQGLSDAVAFIEVTNPASPVYLGCMRAETPNFLWRDVKVYNDHAYVVGDFNPELAVIPHEHEEDPNPDHVNGLQIFDLKRLLTANPLVPQQFDPDGVYTGFDEAHNFVVDEETGFAAAVASDTCGGEFHMLDLSIDPVNPDFLGCYDSGLERFVHDAQCTIYHGPDKEHQGKEICLGFMEEQFAIFDMSNPAAPVTLAPQTPGELVYPGYGYVHQGWFSEDHKTVLSNDELDELNATTAGTPHNTRTYMWDVRDLDNPKFIGTYEGPTGSIDHNMYFKGDFLHQANYVAGYRVLDTKKAMQGILEQVAFFDTHPPDIDAAAFGGVWSGYFHFESGAVALSQIDLGQLFVLQPNLPEDPPEDDDDHDSDGKRDDADSDDDNDGDSDDSDSDDDNDGKKDDADSDDDNDGIDDEYDSKSAKEKQQKKAKVTEGGKTDESNLSVEAGTLLLMAAAESNTADALRVEISDPAGKVIATSVSAAGRALATAVPLTPGTYKISVTNTSGKPVMYNLVTVQRSAW